LPGSNEAKGSMDIKPLYHEEQQFSPAIKSVMIFFDFAVVLFLVFVLRSQPLGSPTVIALIISTVISGMATALILCMKLIVDVTQEGISIRFTPFMNRKIAFSEIKNFEATTYRPIAEYGGWGIRMGLKGMAYNASGNRGVQLELLNNKRVLIGSQNADALAAAIRGGMKN